MKTFTYTLRGIITLIALCLCAQGTFAYAPQTTHAGLTQEILSFYSIESGDAFPIEESELVIQGAIDEDSPDTRCLNHFYDPVHGVGFNGNRTSLDWATNELSGNAFIWKNGIEAYANGDEHRAMVTLGHLLHLVEDASVPDHTRNDPHKGDGLAGLYTGESPFEYWTNQNKDRDSLRGLGKKLSASGSEMDYCSSITSCFNYIAKYSNGNFFSRDTIQGASFLLPIQTRFDKKYGYGIDSLTEREVKLFIFTDDKDGVQVPSLTDAGNYSVISEYFDRIAPQAISVGARVVDLYMTEAKFARAERVRQQAEAQEKVVAEQLSLNMRMKNAGIFQQFAFGFTDLFLATPKEFASSVGTKIAIAGDGLALGYTTTFGNMVIGGNMVVTSGERGGLAVADKVGEVAKAKINSVVIKTTSTIDRTTTDLALLITRLLEARKLLEGMALASTATPAPLSGLLGEVAGASTTASLALLPVSGSDIVSPPPPRIDYGFPQGSVPSSAPKEDTASTTATETTDTSTSTDAVDSEEVASTTPDVVPPADTTAPDAPTIMNFQGVAFAGQDTFDIATTSIVLDGSAEASSTVTLLVVEDATTTAYFSDVQSDMLWNFSLVLAEGTSTLVLTATDAEGNVSSSTGIIVVVTIPLLPPPLPAMPSPSSIRISEVAWSGTVASPLDEWIELENRTDDSFSLEGFAIQTADGGLQIPLFGTLAPHTYFVIASAPDIFSNFTPAMSVSFGDGLDDAGEQLQFARVSDGVVFNEIPLCTDWCNKGNARGATMMIGFWDAGLTFDWNNWFIAGQATWVLDRSGAFIIGTPGVGTESLIAS